MRRRILRPEGTFTRAEVEALLKRLGWRLETAGEAGFWTRSELDALILTEPTLRDGDAAFKMLARDIGMSGDRLRAGLETIRHQHEARLGRSRGSRIGPRQATEETY
jgi:hypothetical protein